MTREINDDQLAVSLRQLKPAAAELDISSVFFDAGYRTAIAERSATKSWMQLVCAALLGGIIIAPASYHLGALTDTQAATSIKAPADNVGEQGWPAHQEVAATDQQPPPLVEPAAESEDHIGFLATVAKNWLVRGEDDPRHLATTLTAAHSSALEYPDLNRQLADIRFGIDDRYQTYAQHQSVLITAGSKTLAVRDSNAMANGGF